jgi:hypothetical protein
MLKELPKLFGRAFAIGFFLPAAIGAAAWVGVAALAGGSSTVTWVNSVASLSDLAVAVGGVWLFAVLLMALNRPIYRMYEGYLVPQGWVRDLLLKRCGNLYSTLRSELAELDAAHGKNALSHEKRRRRARVVRELVQHFPEEEHLLPTRFGNVLRAFETYPRVMYGLDDIPGWLRLAAVMPSDYRALVDDQKALTDFWLNLRFVAFLALLQSAGLWASGGSSPIMFMLALVGFLLLEVTLAHAARSAAVEWGEAVKAAYDVFLPRLRDALRLARPHGTEDEFDQWVAFSRAVIYRDRGSMPGRSPDRTPSPGDGPSRGAT